MCHVQRLPFQQTRVSIFPFCTGCVKKTAEQVSGTQNPRFTVSYMHCSGCLEILRVHQSLIRCPVWVGATGHSWWPARMGLAAPMRRAEVCWTSGPSSSCIFSPLLTFVAEWHVEGSRSYPVTGTSYYSTFKRGSQSNTGAAKAAGIFAKSRREHKRCVPTGMV